MNKVDLHRMVGLLSSDSFTSGEELASHFGVSRAAIAKQLKVLQDSGLEIFSVNRRGYKLKEAVELYDQAKLNKSLSDPSTDLLDILFITDSTNDYIKENANTLGDGFVCIAEAQRQGRGRQGREWFSPFGASIYLSMKWGFPLGFQSLSGLSLAVGVCASRVISKWVEEEVTLKWPNDIYIAGKKAAGVLIEVSGNSDGSCDAIIGIGVNLHMPDTNDIDQPWTDLAKHTPGAISKNLVVAALINELRVALTEFSHNGLATFMEEWQEQDHFKDQNITLILGKNQVTGVARGISTSGALLVDIEDEGKTVRKEFFGGEISVRGA